MSDNEIVAKPVGGKPPEKKEEFKMLLQSVMEQSDGFQLNEKQVDEVLAQRREINGFIRDERMQKHERYKISSKDQKIFFFGVVVFSLIVMLVKPEYFTQVLSLCLGFVGGYGYGKNVEKSERED